jgi:hypothetical protein
VRALRGRAGICAALGAAVLATSACAASVVSGSGSVGGSSAFSGVPFSLPAGHFRANFPEQPTVLSEPGSFGGVSFTLHIARAVDDRGRPTLLADEDASETIPSDQADEALRVAVGSFSGSSGYTLVSQDATSFRGHRARKAALTSPAGDDYTLLVTLWAGRRLYIMLAPSGSIYDTLTGSFEAI